MSKEKKFRQNKRLQITNKMIKNFAQQRFIKKFNLDSLYNSTMTLSQILNIESIQVIIESQFDLTNDA